MKKIRKFVAKTTKAVSYRGLLKDPNWLAKRNSILTRDHNTCQYCGASDRYMQVHHLVYHEGAKPWEYDDDELITLCDKCHEDVSETQKNLYDNFLMARNELRNHGFSDAVLYSMFSSIMSALESVDNKNIISWNFKEIKDLLTTCASGGSYGDVKALAKNFGVGFVGYVQSEYPMFKEQYEGILQKSKKEWKGAKNEKN